MVAAPCQGGIPFQGEALPVAEALPVVVPFQGETLVVAPCQGEAWRVMGGMVGEGGKPQNECGHLVERF